MPATCLPDEIIVEILAPALKDSAPYRIRLRPYFYGGLRRLPDRSRTVPAHAGSHFSESPSAYLLVCKAWLRVSTPLLYNVVVLRSTAQAKALSSVVASNSQLGSFVHKLRVEGGYGSAMHTLLKHTPNITDLYLSFDLYPRDSTDGLCKGLSLINPIRLILADLTYFESGSNTASKLIDALIRVGPNWNNLTVLDISCPSHYGPSNWLTRIAEASAREKHLSTIVVGSVKLASKVAEALKGCPPEVIRISPPLRSELELDSAILLRRTLAAAGKTSLQYQINIANNSQPNIPRYHYVNRNPNFVPLAAAPQEIQDSIWSLILEFACFPINRTANQLLLVCKRFSRLALPHVYATVTLVTRKSALKLARTTFQSHSPAPPFAHLP
ncbi:hypothetical protein C8F01DRAFT_1266616 [Mycena amicta]|nr:hypothetical protein C8F01DRAFT_1266616 [Mycena amicta]